jgi:hypothetical protein
MDQVSQSLPLRIIPTKDSQALPIVYSLLFLGFVGLFARSHNPLILVERNDPAGYLFLLLFAVFSLIPIAGLAVSVIKLLPGSPYYYLEIAPRGIAIRQGFKTKRFAWSELSPFSVHTEVVTRRRKYGGTSTTTYYYVVAVPAADAALLQDSSKRDSHAIFRILADEYGAGDAEEDASTLAVWLTEIRSNALANSNRATAKVSVPLEFRGTVIAAAVRLASPLATKKSSVIER